MENFLKLVDAEFYDGLIFHRVIANFMIQGGGYTPALQHQDGGATVRNESFNGVKNKLGTVAMARMADPEYWISSWEPASNCHGSKADTTPPEIMNLSCVAPMRKLLRPYMYTSSGPAISRAIFRREKLVEEPGGSAGCG